MRLESLTVRGVLRFREAVTVDLRSLPAGLIAVCGENGAGKTTIVESAIAALYRMFPSRADRELVDYAGERDSYLEALFAVHGRGVYRARVNLDGVKRHSDAVLEQILPDGSKAMLNDGKVSTFDQAIAQVFPAREVLLASAVAAQNKAGSFVTLDKKGRKDLFSRLLGLEHYEAMATTARTAAGFCEQARLKLAAQREMLERDAAPAVGQAIEADDTRIALELTRCTEARLQLHSAIEALERDRAGLQEQAQRHVAVTTRLGALADQSTALKFRISDLTRQRDAAERAAEQERRALDATHTKRLGDLDERLRNNAQVLADAEAIRAAATEVETLGEARDAAAREVTSAEAAMRVVEAEHRRLETLAHQQRQAQTALDRARDDSAILDTVPCEGAGGFADCQFLARATKAKGAIAGLEAQAAGLSTTDAAIEALPQAYTTQKDALTRAQRHHRDLEQRIAAAAVKAKLLPAVEHAEERLRELRRDREALLVEAQQQLAAVDTRLSAALVELTEQATAAQTEQARLTADIATATAEQETTRSASERLARVDVDLSSARRSWDQSTSDLARIEATLQDLARRRERWEQARAQVAEVDGRLRQVEQHAIDWQLLTKALGREGLPVLEIDAAGPTVSSFTNDLLGVCFGPRFTVDLVTQTPKADGKGQKEVFELKVFDNLRGGDARDIGDLSGGEQILVDEALKNALSLYINSRNVSPIETCWRDETTGPLDPDNATRYLEMLRRVQQIGGFHQILFVTHNRDAAASADAQLRVANGTVSVALPPYGVAQEAA